MRYLHGSRSKLTRTKDTRLGSIINETASFNARSLGGHILIWPFFILGTECSQARDREFVIDQLQYLWEWTGFANTLRAIETLKQFWSDDIGNGWIQGLVKQVDVFIM